VIRPGPIKRKKPIDRAGAGSSAIGSQRPPKQRSRSKRAGVASDTAEAVKERDQECQAWPLGFALDVRCSGRGHIHHRVLRSQGGGHDAGNLLLICEAHHDLAHNSRRSEAEAATVIIRKTKT
jgi:hypothetical protein